jgi:hypothetical protein
LVVVFPFFPRPPFPLPDIVELGGCGIGLLLLCGVVAEAMRPTALLASRAVARFRGS